MRPAHLRDGCPHYLQPCFLRAEIGDEKWHFVDQHLCHAASAFHASNFKRAAILTIDGGEEKATTPYYQRRKCAEVTFLHSSDEYQVMTLASHGEPVFVGAFRDMIHLGKNGLYTIDVAKIFYGIYYRYAYTLCGFVDQRLFFSLPVKTGVYP